MMDIAHKRKQALAVLTVPEGLVFDGAVMTYHLDAPATEKQTETPFFGGYMEDMLEDMGVVEHEEAPMEILATA